MNGGNDWLGAVSTKDPLQSPPQAPLGFGWPNPPKVVFYTDGSSADVTAALISCAAALPKALRI